MPCPICVSELFLVLKGSGREVHSGQNGYNLGKSFQESHWQPHPSPPLTTSLWGSGWVDTFLQPRQSPALAQCHSPGETVT